MAVLIRIPWPLCSWSDNEQERNGNLVALAVAEGCAGAVENHLLGL
jgi:hypothetical protein